MIAAKRLRGERLPAQLLLGTLLLGAGFALALLPLSWLAIGIAGAILITLTAIRPRVALYLIAFAIPFGSLFEISLGGISVGLTEGLIGLMIASWIARTIALREKWGKWPRLSTPLGLFVGATLLSLLNATSMTFAAKEIVKWLEVLAVLAFVVNVITIAESRTLVACLLLAGVAQALLGVYQFLTQSGPEFFILHGRFMRAYGTFEQPNPYAGYLGLIAPVALALALALLERKVATDASRTPIVTSIRRHWLNWLALLSLAAVTAAIGMSWSRGAWLGFAAAFIVVNLVRSQRGTVLFALGVLALATWGMLGGIRLLPGIVRERLTSFLPLAQVRDVRPTEVTDDNYASVERLAHWQSALDMWRDHPWLGVGFGNYETAYPGYALPKWPLALGHAHNYYLNIAAEAGLLGLIAYLVLWTSALWQVWRAIGRANTPYARALALGALGMLVHVSVHNVVDNLWVHNMYVQVAIVLGLVDGLCVQPDGPVLNSVRSGYFDL